MCLNVVVEAFSAFLTLPSCCRPLFWVNAGSQAQADFLRKVFASNPSLSAVALCLYGAREFSVLFPPLVCFCSFPRNNRLLPCPRTQIFCLPCKTYNFCIAKAGLRKRAKLPAGPPTAADHLLQVYEAEEVLIFYPTPTLSCSIQWDSIEKSLRVSTNSACCWKKVEWSLNLVQMGTLTAEELCGFLVFAFSSALSWNILPHRQQQSL